MRREGAFQVVLKPGERRERAKPGAISRTSLSAQKKIGKIRGKRGEKRSQRDVEEEGEIYRGG